MTYDYLRQLKSTNRTLRLINSDNFAMSVSFFYTVFIKKRRTTIAHTLIVQELEDYLYYLNEDAAASYTKTAAAYLDDFAGEQSGYLRKYYGDVDEPLYELTPQAQKALEWVESLEKQAFVGSRSRFTLIFELLEELEFETAIDDAARIERLETQKAELDARIEAIRAKRDLRFDASRIREQYQQIEENVRRLKYDFAQIEYNFRELNAGAMERIATDERGKGEVLGAIFERESDIRESDEGRSFFAFWQLLTDAQRHEKLAEMTENLYRISAIADFDEQRRLRHLKYDLLRHGEKIVTVTARLGEQLRRYIDDRAWTENRRILTLCQSIEKQAIALRDDPPKSRAFMPMHGERIRIDSIDAKTLYRIKRENTFEQELREETISVDMETFFHLFYVDETELKRNIDSVLQHRSQCSIAEVAERFAVTKGVSELIGYLSIAKRSDRSRVDETRRERIRIEDSDGNAKTVVLPKVIFVRKGSA